MPQKFDLVIVGAGLVGCSLGLALQQQGLKIAVLEKHLPDFTAMDNEKFRPISLAYSSVKMLQTLSIWPQLATTAAAIHRVQVSEQGAFGDLVFTSEEYELDALGQVVSFHALHRALYQQLSQQDGVSVLPIIELQSIGEKILIETNKGMETLETALLVGADGSHSTVRKLLKIPAITREKSESALTAKLTLNDAHHATALERFTASGIFAALPLPNAHECGLVWTMPAQKVDEIKGWDESQLQNFVAQQFARHLNIASLQRGALWPLQTITASEQITEKAVLLGNAAHTIYPLAAQGFNLGLRDAAALAEVLVDALQANENIGDKAVLQRYLDWRNSDQKTIMRLTGGIASAATLNIPFIKCVRGLGLLATDLLPPLKNRIAKSTLGLSGKLPKLARGLPLW